jgi:hypothetical protein
MTTLFDFTASAKNTLKQITSESPQRRYGTVAETCRHSIVHTWSPDATIHHVVIAACHHPIQAKADLGEHYMVAYISIPMEWRRLLDTKLCKDWDVSFIGPAGVIQRLPPALRDVADIIDGRIYVGFDWFWLAANDPPIQQPHYDKIKPRLIQFASQVREMWEHRK